MQLIKSIFLLISFFGFYMKMKKKLEIKEELIPIILFSFIIIIEFLAGILNCMKLVEIIIVLLGVVLCVKEVFFMIIKKEKPTFSFNLLIFSLFFIWFSYLLKGRILTHYDNFSHWAMIIREMLITDKLPNFQSELIMFKSYPPGTACFVYFMCKFLGNSESKMLFAQSILILSGIYTLFSFCDKNRKMNYLFIIPTCIYLIIGNIFIDQLLVDTVLPVLGIATFVIIFQYKDDSKKGIFYSIPVLSALILVKNSGIFFIIVDVMVWFYFYIKNNGFKSIFSTKYIVIVLLPILLQCVFNWHIDLVFENANSSKHSMSLYNYAVNFKNKESSDIKQISANMLRKILDFRIKENIIFLLLFVSYIIMIIIARKNKKLRIYIYKAMFLFIMIYILYQISLLGMYIFSMPINEARDLASYIRYYRTIILFEYSIFVISLINYFDSINIKQRYKNLIIKFFFLIILVVPIILYRADLKNLIIKNIDKTSIRYQILDTIETYKIETKKSYIIYGIDDSVGYLYYVCKYDLRSNDVKVIKNLEQLQSTDEIFNYDYIIVLKHDEEIDKILNILKGDVKDVVRIK